jgi:hypothetical protein
MRMGAQTLLKGPRFPLATLDKPPQGVRVVDFTDTFCDEIKCYAVRGGKVVTSDRSHFTVDFARHWHHALRI